MTYVYLFQSTLRIVFVFLNYNEFGSAVEKMDSASGFGRVRDRVNRRPPVDDCRVPAARHS